MALQFFAFHNNSNINCMNNDRGGVAVEQLGVGVQQTHGAAAGELVLDDPHLDRVVGQDGRLKVRDQDLKELLSSPRRQVGVAKTIVETDVFLDFGGEEVAELQDLLHAAAGPM